MWQRPVRWWVSFGAALGLSVLVACSDGDGVRVAGPVPTAPTTTSTTAPPTTSTTVAPVTSTRLPATTTSTTPRPVLVDGIPQVTATPTRGPVGTRVRIDGTGFTEQTWKGESFLWLAKQTDCGALYAQAEHTVRVSADGRLSGEFVVPSMGGCRMSDLGGPVSAGTYRIIFSCTPCTIGQFEVTGTTTECDIVAFTPNSDDVASGIVAFNMGCAEAQALIRKADATVGRTPVDVDGFRCVLVSESGDRTLGLPSTTFECTSGARKVVYVRT